jgi:hypothetical protein
MERDEAGGGRERACKRARKSVGNENGEGVTNELDYDFASRNIYPMFCRAESINNQPSNQHRQNQQHEHQRRPLRNKY